MKKVKKKKKEKPRARKSFSRVKVVSLGPECNTSSPNRNTLREVGVFLLECSSPSGQLRSPLSMTESWYDVGDGTYTESYKTRPPRNAFSGQMPAAGPCRFLGCRPVQPPTGSFLHQSCPWTDSGPETSVGAATFFVITLHPTQKITSLKKVNTTTSLKFLMDFS